MKRKFIGPGGRALAVLAFGAFIAAGSGAAVAETIVVVRHCDRDREKPDQPLLPVGKHRAIEVGRLLRRDRVDHVFFTRDENEKPQDWLRMCQTAQGICGGLAETAPEGGPGGEAVVTPERMPRFADDALSLRQWILGEDGKAHAHVEATDHVDVVVLHHEAIPDLLDVLMSPDDPKQGPHVKVGREDYDNVFVLSRANGDKKFSLLRLTVTPPPATRPADTQPAGSCEDEPARGGGGAPKSEKGESGENKDAKK